MTNEHLKSDSTIRGNNSVSERVDILGVLWEFNLQGEGDEVYLQIAAEYFSNDSFNP